MLVAQPTLSSRRVRQGIPGPVEESERDRAPARRNVRSRGRREWRNVASKASVVGDVKVLRYETVACRARVVEQGEGVVVGLIVLLWGRQ